MNATALFYDFNTEGIQNTTLDMEPTENTALTEHGECFKLNKLVRILFMYLEDTFFNPFLTLWRWTNKFSAGEDVADTDIYIDIHWFCKLWLNDLLFNTWPILSQPGKLCSNGLVDA